MSETRHDPFIDPQNVCNDDQESGSVGQSEPLAPSEEPGADERDTDQQWPSLAMRLLEILEPMTFTLIKIKQREMMTLGNMLKKFERLLRDEKQRPMDEKRD